MKKNNKNQNSKRILGRQVAKELSKRELQAITGGITSCTAGNADDCAGH